MSLAKPCTIIILGGFFCCDMKLKIFMIHLHCHLHAALESRIIHIRFFVHFIYLFLFVGCSFQTLFLIYLFSEFISNFSFDLIDVYVYYNQFVFSGKFSVVSIHIKEVNMPVVPNPCIKKKLFILTIFKNIL